jgi:rhodanese-related sulfurtransferase
MGPINTLGPTPLPRPLVPERTPTEVAGRDQHTVLVDARPRADVAAGHLPGGLSVELSDDFGVWVGWLAPFNAPLNIVLNPDQDLNEAVLQLGRIGFDHVGGVLRGVDAWRAEGRPLERFELVGVAEFVEAVRSGRASQVLDVRAPKEWESGHLKGSIHRYAADLAADVPDELDRGQPVWVACASGFRATIAASLLERAGFRPVVLTDAGIPDVLERLGKR